MNLLITGIGSAEYVYAGKWMLFVLTDVIPNNGGGAS